MPPFQDYKISLRKKKKVHSKASCLARTLATFFLVEIPRLFLLRAYSWKSLDFFVGKGLAGPCQLNKWCLCLEVVLQPCANFLLLQRVVFSA